MPRRSDKSLVPSGVAVAPKIDVSCRNSTPFATASSSLPTSPKGAPKRFRPPSLLSSSRSSPRAATSSASAASFSQHEHHSDGSSSSDAADCDGPAPSVSRRIRRRVASASSAPAHLLPLLRSASSDSYFVSAINRNPSICLFAALSPRSDFSLLCDDFVLSALSEDPPSSNPHSPAATTAQLKPLSRLKVRAATSVLFTSCSRDSVSGRCVTSRIFLACGIWRRGWDGERFRRRRQAHAQLQLLRQCDVASDDVQRLACCTGRHPSQTQTAA